MFYLSFLEEVGRIFVAIAKNRKLGKFLKLLFDRLIDTIDSV
jgi:hypothetical protein